MLPNVRTTAIASLAALSLALGAAAPARALGNEERDFLKGAAAAALIGVIINETRERRAAPVTRYYQEPAYPQYYQQPRKLRQRHDEPRYGQPRYDQPRYDPPRYGRVIPNPGPVSIYASPAAQAFNSYTLAERRAIQRSLAAAGYYTRGVDGAYGPGTHAAILAYARDAGMANRLGTRDSAYGIYDGLIF